MGFIIHFVQNPAKQGTLTKNLKIKTYFLYKGLGSMVSAILTNVNDYSTFWQSFLVQNRAVVEDYSRNPGVVSSNPTKTLPFHLEIQFFENFHRGSYFVGSQTKWIMTP